MDGGFEGIDLFSGVATSRGERGAGGGGGAAFLKRVCYVFRKEFAALVSHWVLF